MLGVGYHLAFNNQNHGPFEIEWFVEKLGMSSTGGLFSISLYYLVYYSAAGRL